MEIPQDNHWGCSITTTLTTSLWPGSQWLHSTPLGPTNSLSFRNVEKLCHQQASGGNYGPVGLN